MGFDLPLAAWLPALMLALVPLVAVPGIMAFWRSFKAKEDLERRLERKHMRSPEQEEARNESRIGRAVIGLANKATPVDEEKISVVRAKLIQAGYTEPHAVGRYFATRLISVLLLPILFLLALPYLGKLPTMAILSGCIIAVGAGLIGPDFFLNQRISKRQDQCSAGFPDMMDLMVACVEAGLSLDAAVQRVGEELELRHPIIAGHMRTLSLELRAGRARKSAWRAFADRMGVEEASSLATMLRQAEEMGTSLGQTLRIFSADMRKRRILMAEEKAMALPAKLTLPLIVFVFPVLLGVLVLPAVVKLQGVFS